MKKMMTQPNQDIYRIHFCIYLFGAIILLWLTYLPINAIRFNWSHPFGKYQLVSFLVLASAILEILTRSPNKLLISCLVSRQINEISNRQTLFTMVFVFGFMIMSKDSELSRSILGLYTLAFYLWSLWMNQFGYRILVRFYYSDRNKVYELHTVKQLKKAYTYITYNVRKL